jgi:hypothetical protein
MLWAAAKIVKRNAVVNISYNRQNKKGVVYKLERMQRSK